MNSTPPTPAGLSVATAVLLAGCPGHPLTHPTRTLSLGLAGHPSPRSGQPGYQPVPRMGQCRLEPHLLPFDKQRPCRVKTGGPEAKDTGGPAKPWTQTRWHLDL